MLLRLQVHHVRLTVILDQEVRGHGQLARGGPDHMAEIAENVVIGIGRDGRIEPHAVPNPVSYTHLDVYKRQVLVGLACS